MMMLKDPDLGDVHPSEHSFKRSSQYARALHEVIEANDALNETLDDEWLCDFQCLMVDAKICMDRIAAMWVHDLNVVLAEARKAVMEKHSPGENDLYMRTLELAQINEDAYFSRVVHDDLNGIIREAHKKDSTTADEVDPSDIAKQKLESAMSYEGSPEERQARLFCKQLGTTYYQLSEEEFVTLITIVKKSLLLKGQPNKQGRTSQSVLCNIG